MKPISLRIRHARILRDARAALARGGREPELRRAHNAAVLRKARAIVAQAQEQKRLRRCAKLAALKALHAARDAYGKISSSTTSDIDQHRWRERQALVEAELMQVVRKASI